MAKPDLPITHSTPIRRFSRRNLYGVVVLLLAAPVWGQAPYQVAENGDLALPGGTLPIAAYWPEAEGSYPLIIFSHGAGADRGMAPDMMRHWAAHGYVVILPTHRPQITPFEGPGLLRAAQEFRERNRAGPIAWRHRVGEVKRILDSLESGEGWPDAVLERVDLERVGMGGHSFGAYTALLIAGAKLYSEQLTYNYRDERVDAVIVISGPGTDGHGLRGKSFDFIETPMLVFAGSEDPGTPSEGGPEWRAEPFYFAPRDGKYLAFIEGSDHATYVGGLASAMGESNNPFRRLFQLLSANENTGENRRIYEFTRHSATVFFDAYLKDDAQAKATLESGKITAKWEEMVKWLTR